MVQGQQCDDAARPLPEVAANPVLRELELPEQGDAERRPAPLRRAAISFRARRGHVPSRFLAVSGRAGLAGRIRCRGTARAVRDVHRRALPRAVIAPAPQQLRNNSGPRPPGSPARAGLPGRLSRPADRRSMPDRRAALRPCFGGCVAFLVRRRGVGRPRRRPPETRVRYGPDGERRGRRMAAESPSRRLGAVAPPPPYGCERRRGDPRSHTPRQRLASREAEPGTPARPADQESLRTTAPTCHAGGGHRAPP